MNLFEPEAIIAPSPQPRVIAGGFSLRDYQVEDCDAVEEAWASGKRGVVVRLATGTGKSVVAAELTRRRLPMGRVLVLVDVGSLANDLYRTIIKHAGITPAILTGPQKTHWTEAKAVVATVQSMYAGGDDPRYRKFDPTQFQTVIIDECLKGNSMISMSDGSRRTIKSIVEDGVVTSVCSFNHATQKTENRLAVGVKKSVAKRMCAVRFSNGVEINCTPNHKFFTQDGYVEAASLTTYHYVLYLSQDGKHHTQERRTRTQETARGSNFDSRAVCLRNTAWRRLHVSRHGAREAMRVSKNDHPALPKTRTASLGKIPNNGKRLRNTTGQATTAWMGNWFGWIRHTEPASVRFDLCHVLPKWEEKDFEGVAQQIRRARYGLVVHGRRVAHNCRWTSDIHRGIPKRSAGNYLAMDGREMGNKCRSNAIQEEPLLPSTSEERRAQILLIDRAARYPRNEIQVISDNNADMQGVRECVFPKTSQAGVLHERRVLPCGSSTMGKGEIPKGQGGNLGEKSRGGDGSASQENMRHMRSLVHDWSEKTSGLPRCEMQDKNAKVGKAEVVCNEPRTCFGENGRVSVESVSYYESNELVYDLCVESNHNFFANGVLVHNCETTIADRYSETVRWFTDGNPALKLAGLSATPFRTDGRGMGEMFDHANQEPGPLNRDIIWSVLNGWLVRPRQGFVRCSLDFSTLKVRKQEDGEKDYSDDDIAGLMMDQDEQQWRQMAEGIHKAAQGRPSIVMCPNSVEVAKLVAFHLCGAAGDKGSAQPVYGAQGEQADDLMKAYKNGDYPYIVAVKKLEKGFDYDKVKCGFMLRKTKSRRMYEQFLGRLVRPLVEIRETLNNTPDAALRVDIIAKSAKAHCTLYDLVGVHPSAKDMGVIDILGHKLSEELRERVKQNQMEEGEGESDVGEDAREAAEELKREKKAKLVASEEERRKRASIEIGSQVEIEITDNFGVGAPPVGLNRMKRGTASPRQINFAIALGVDGVRATGMSNGQIGAIITALKNGGRQPDWKLANNWANAMRKAKPELAVPSWRQTQRLKHLGYTGKKPANGIEADKIIREMESHL